jgi:hypothetical protein
MSARIEVKTDGASTAGLTDTLSKVEAQAPYSSIFGRASSGAKMYVGTAAVGGFISAVAIGSGSVDNSTFVEGLGIGSMTIGYVNGQGFLLGDAHAGLVVGYATGTNSTVRTSTTKFASCAIGFASAGGVIHASEDGAMARGYVTGASATLLSSGLGSFASAYCATGALINSSGQGSAIFGRASGSSTQINASNNGSFACGVAANGGIITSSGTGSFVVGEANAGGTLSSGVSSGFIFGNVTPSVGVGTLSNSAQASFVHGKLTTAGTSFTATTGGVGSFMGGTFHITTGTKTFTVAGEGSFFHGRVSDFNTFSQSGIGSAFLGSVTTTSAAITLTGEGAVMMGRIAGTISASGSGSFIQGSIDGTTSSTATGLGSAIVGAHTQSGAANFMQSTGAGSLAGGRADGGSSIIASGQGSTARGYSTAGRSIISSSAGTLAGGYNPTGNVEASGAAALSWGDDIITSANNAQAFGQGHVNNSFLSAKFGRFSVTPTANNSTWVSTDTLFVIGNGASTASRANAFVVLKDATVQFQGVIDSSATAVTGKGLPVWKKYLVNFNDPIAIAALTNDVALFSLPAYGVIHSVVISHVTPFDDGVGPMTAYTLSVGIAGDLTKYATAFDVLQAAGSGVGQTSSVADFESKAGATSIRVAATSVGANLDTATAGQAEIWVLWGTMQ